MLASGTSGEDFQALADQRLREARVLFAAGEFGGAYYLGGYCIECALKAVIAKSIPARVLLPKKAVAAVHEHDLHKLLDLAELTAELRNHPGMARSWTVVAGWKTEQRYELRADKASAKGLLDSIDHPKDGILPWLKQRW